MELARKLLIESLPKSALEKTFFTLAEELCAKANSHGYQLLSHDPLAIKKFRLLSEIEQIGVVSRLYEYSKLCLAALEEGKDLDDCNTLLWHALRTLGLRHHSDLFSHLEKGDVIEVYTPDFKQVFRNFEFYKISSYPFTYMYLYEWRELYARSDSITAQIVSVGIDLFSGKYDQTIPSTIPTHYLEEIFSLKKNYMKMNQKIFSPLFDSSGRVGGVVTTSKVELIRQEQTTDYQPSN